MSDVPAAQVSGLTLRYGRTIALDAATLTLPTGTIVGLVGRNGAGKTSLLRVLAGLEPGYSGVARVHGLDARHVGRRPGLVHLDAPLRATADQSLASLLGHLRRARPGFDADAAARWLDAFGVRKRGTLRALSGGQASAARLSLALASRAPLTLLDEPTLGMDAPSRDLTARAIVEEFEAYPRAFVISTHLIDEASPLFERLWLLDAGRVVADDDAEALRERYVRVQGDAETVAALPHLGELDRLGRRASALVKADDAPEDASLQVAPVTLQQLVGALTSPRKEQ